MINASAFQFSSQHDSWSEVVRLCRRICLLRERGLPDDAARLRAGPLADLIARLRIGGESDGVINDRLEKIFAAETERVADAAVLAELLAPMLNGRTAAPVLLAESNPAEPRVDDTPLPFPAAEPAPPRRRSTEIADFLDEMIAQERSPNPARARA